MLENILADWFEEQGVRLRRQPELVKEQSVEIGRPKVTPDILFLDHVEINGQPVAWTMQSTSMVQMSVSKERKCRNK